MYREKGLHDVYTFLKSINSVSGICELSTKNKQGITGKTFVKSVNGVSEMSWIPLGIETSLSF